MATLNTLVLISKEQRAHILNIDERHPGRSTARAVRLGFEFIHTPLRDYGMITFCLDGTIRFATETAERRTERLKWDPAGEQVPVGLEQDFHDAAVKHFTAVEFKPIVGFSLCLWYGLLAYHCKIRSLREALWGNYPRRSDHLMAKLLTDGKTYAGMAYLAGSSGGNMRCKTCEFYQHRRGRNGKELEGHCAQYASMMGTGPIPRFPSSALACKYHEERSDQ